MVKLSTGIISSHLNRGVVPPEDQAVFRVILTKEIESSNQNGDPAVKHRLAVTDAETENGERYNRGLIVVQRGDGKILPTKGDVVDFGFPENCMFENKKSFIWIIKRYRILGANNAEVTPSTPSTSGQVNGHNSCPPMAKKARADVESHHGTPSPPNFSRSPAPSSSSAGARRNLFGETTSSAANPTHKIKDLNPYQNKYTLCARVVVKGELKEIQSSRWSGKVFNMTLRDESGDIQATGFNEFAAKFAGIVEDGKVYYVSNAQVKSIKNPNFNKTGHQYELGLNQNTVINECHRADAASTVPKVVYNFTKISDVPRRDVKDFVDVIGVCVEMQELRELTTRNGRQTKKRDLMLIDDSESGGASIRMTIWSEKAEQFDGLLRIASFKDSSVSEFQGTKNLSLSFNGSLEVDPDIPEAKRLKSWYLNNEHQLATQSTNSMTPAVDSDNVWTLAEMKLDFGTGNGVPSYTVEAYVQNFLTESLAYKACPVDGCNKKLEERDDGTSFYCNKCKKKEDKFKFRYLVRGVIADATDFVYFTAFDEAASVLLATSAEFLTRIKEEEPRKFDKVITAVKFHMFKMRLQCKTETFNDSKQLKCTLVSSERVNHSNPERVNKLREFVNTHEKF